MREPDMRCKSCRSYIRGFLKRGIPPEDRVTIIDMERKELGVALSDGGYLCAACAAEKCYGIIIGNCDHPFTSPGTGSVPWQREKRKLYS
jgi:hypothetical protein